MKQIFSVKIWLFCIFLTRIFISTSMGSIYYVDNSPTSNCSNNPSYGLETNPWCTISYALGQIRSGDTIYVKTGTYNETLYISNLYGTENSRTLIKAHVGCMVTLQGNGINTGRVKITGCNYLILDGFHITNMNQGIFIEGSSTHVTVKNCTIYAIGQEGIHIRENCSYITLEGNTIYNTDLYIYNGEGIYIGTGSTGPLDNSHHITVSNNTIYNVGDEAIELKPGTHDCLIEGNMIFNAVSGKTWGAIEVNESILGVQYWNSNPNHIVRNNIIHDTDTAIRAGTGCIIYNNIIYDIDSEDYGIFVNNPTNDPYTRKIYHNTIDVSSSNAINMEGSNTDVRNNIGPLLEFNLSSDSSFFISTTEGKEDYHLKYGVAPIDAGIDLTNIVGFDIDGDLRPHGLNVDIGADEYIFGTKPSIPQNLRIIK